MISLYVGLVVDVVTVTSVKSLLLLINGQSWIPYQGLRWRLALIRRRTDWLLRRELLLFLLLARIAT